MTAKIIVRSIALMALIGASGTGVANAAERSPVVPLFEEVWAGKNPTPLPGNLVDPKILHDRLLAEGPSDKWKDKVEAPVKLAIAKIKFGTVLAHSVQCSATVCETMVLVKAPNVVGGKNIGEWTAQFVGEDVGSIAAATGAETSAVVGGGNAPDEQAILVYTFWK